MSGKSDGKVGKGMEGGAYLVLANKNTFYTGVWTGVREGADDDSRFSIMIH